MEEEPRTNIVPTTHDGYGCVYLYEFLMDAF